MKGSDVSLIHFHLMPRGGLILIKRAVDHFGEVCPGVSEAAVGKENQIKIIFWKLNVQRAEAGVSTVVGDTGFAVPPGNGAAHAHVIEGRRR